MVERTPFFDIVSQIVLFLGLLTALAPFAIVAIAATHDIRTVNQVPMPLAPGHHFLENLAEAWQQHHHDADAREHQHEGRGQCGQERDVDPHAGS